MTESLATASMLASVSDELANTVERAGAAVVTVDARRRHPASGIAWSTDGLIVTANHVVERDEELEAALPDGRRVAATLVGRDPASDLALLRLAEGGLTPLPPAAEPRVGHLTLALGRPGPSGVMASLGAVAAVGGPMRFRGGASLERYVCADVAMLPGFSGGPLVDMSGALIGLNSSTLGHSGQLTVPVSSITTAVQTLLQHGHVRRGYLGIGAQTVHLPQGLADAAGQRHGLLVVSVEQGGPADAAGLILGDILLSIAGDQVEHVEQLQDRLTSDRIGISMPVRVVRGGELREIPVTIAERRRQAE
ncbi:MAG: trypsin-like peptidase domain-containing protein [Thermomicrobiales bacterium]|nr:trypsin-like peptidase domain-containing protein [Thermomicrobiales bacterium]